MAIVIAVTNQKGGVGKTTTAVNLSAGLALKLRHERRSPDRVLLVDVDPQGHALLAVGFGRHHTPPAESMAALLTESPPPSVQRMLRPAAHHPNLDFLPSNTQAMTAARMRLPSLLARESRLSHALAPILPYYAFVVIDTPPTLDDLMINALVAADAVIIPMQCEYYALEGLTALVSTIRRIRESLNPMLEIEGLLRTMYDPRNRLDNEVSAQLKQHFGDKLYRTIIPRNVRLAEAPSYGKAVIAYDLQSKGAQAYLALAGEILRRQEEAA